ncbi:MAG: fatty acid desaturase [Stellaceae bacterium]
MAPYARADHRRAMAQLLNTGPPFLLLMAALLCGAKSYPALTLPLAVPTALLLVRLFAIQHDCGHGSFFASRRANDLLGRALGVLTLTPYAFWRKSHAIHHTNSGNLDRRGTGEVRTLTVREYHSLSLSQRLRYRILGTNAALAAIVMLMLLTVGARAFMLGYLPVILLAASTGIWLFYIQHQFEHSYWASGPDWDFHAAALKGSSFYDLPAVLHWQTGYIGFHHIHHDCSKIPNYGLRDCFDQNPEFRDARRLTLLDSLKCLRLSLWDEERQLLVSFRDAFRRQRASEG